MVIEPWAFYMACFTCLAFGFAGGIVLVVYLRAVVLKAAYRKGHDDGFNEGLTK